MSSSIACLYEDKATESVMLLPRKVEFYAQLEFVSIKRLSKYHATRIVFIRMIPLLLHFKRSNNLRTNLFKRKGMIQVLQAIRALFEDPLMVHWDLMNRVKNKCKT